MQRRCKGGCATNANDVQARSGLERCPAARRLKPGSNLANRARHKLPVVLKLQRSLNIEVLEAGHHLLQFIA